MITGTTPITTRVPWERPEVPMVIMSAVGRLFAGSGFFMSDDNRYINFFIDPCDLFPDGNIHVEVSEGEKVSLIHRLLNFQPGDFDIQDVVNFLMGSGDFKTALASLLGYEIIRYDVVLSSVTPFKEGYIYRSENFELRVPYTHTPLKVGVLYRKGMIVGRDVQVSFGNNWWTADPLNVGERFMFFRDLFPFLGSMMLPNHFVPAYAIKSDEPGNPDKTHIRFQVFKDRDIDDRYWNYVWKNETRTGRYLNMLVGLPCPPEKRVDIIGPPICWDEVMVAYKRTQHFINLFGLKEDKPDISALPYELSKMVNPFDLIMRAGYSEVYQHVVMDHRDVVGRLDNICRFLHLSAPADKIRNVYLTPFAVDSETSITSQSDWVVREGTLGAGLTINSYVVAAEENASLRSLSSFTMENN